jgi:hypothetical protein
MLTTIWLGFVAGLALVGTIFGAFFKGRAAGEQKRQLAEKDAIIKAEAVRRENTQDVARADPQKQIDELKRWER